MESIHYQQRTILHADIPDHPQLEHDLTAALRSFNAKVHVHATHIHVFAELSPATRPIFQDCIQEVLRHTQVTWDPKMYVTPLTDCSPATIKAVLDELHRMPKV